MTRPTAPARSVAPADAAALGRMFERLWAEGAHRWFHPHPLDIATAHAIATNVTLDHYAVVAGADGELVAYGMLRGYAEGYNLPSLGIAVVGEARGSGASQAMMQHLHDTARARGSTQVRLKVYPDNIPARRLYDRLGYRFSATPAADGQLVGLLDL